MLQWFAHDYPLFLPLALARQFHSLGAKLILASRNVQQLQRLKFELDNNHTQKVCLPHL